MKGVLIIFLIVSLLFSPFLYAGDADSLYNSIITSYKNGDYPNSISLSKEFLKKYRNDEKSKDVLMILGVAFAKNGDTEKAIKVLKYSDKKYPDYEKNDKVKLLLGKLYYNSGKYDKAENVLTSLIDTHKDSKYIPTAQSLLNDIRSKSKAKAENKKISKKAAKSVNYKYSWKKITWAKIGAGVALIASPIFYFLGNSTQKEADDIYNNKYLTATTTDDAVKYYNQAADKDNLATTYKNISFASLVLGGVFFAVDYFYAGRIYIKADKNGTLNISYSHNF